MKSDEASTIRDRLFESWFKYHYLDLILFFLLIYTLLPILAPVLLHFNFGLPARIIYWIYGFFCHQLPFRSWFLFGSQTFYPLSITGIKHVLYFEEVFKFDLKNYESLAKIIGNSFTGYKIALCQRDIAMYSSLLVFGFLFKFLKRNIKRIPLWVWIIFGVIPLGIDGITQVNGNYSSFIHLSRESTPLLRTVTGTLFGVFTGWYIFPSMELLIYWNGKKGYLH